VNVKLIPDHKFEKEFEDTKKYTEQIWHNTLLLSDTLRIYFVTPCEVTRRIVKLDYQRSTKWL